MVDSALFLEGMIVAVALTIKSIYSLERFISLGDSRDPDGDTKSGTLGMVVNG